MISDPRWPHFSAQSESMVAEQLEKRGIHDPAVLKAFRVVPRHKFVPLELQDQAYEDHPLAIGAGQTISQPYMVAWMTELLGIGTEDKVLEIGTGSGYQTAILAELGAEVFSVERVGGLQETAKDVLERLQYDNVHYRIGDGTLGWPEEAPFDAILVAAGAPKAPPSLLAQLAIGGRLIIPLGDRNTQQLNVITRGNRDYDVRPVGACKFVPLIGKESWPD